MCVCDTCMHTLAHTVNWCILKSWGNSLWPSPRKFCSAYLAWCVYAHINTRAHICNKPQQHVIHLYCIYVHIRLPHWCRTFSMYLWLRLTRHQTSSNLDVGTVHRHWQHTRPWHAQIKSLSFNAGREIVGEAAMTAILRNEPWTLEALGITEDVVKKLESRRIKENPMYIPKVLCTCMRSPMCVLVAWRKANEWAWFCGTRMYSVLISKICPFRARGWWISSLSADSCLPCFFFSLCSFSSVWQNVMDIFEQKSAKQPAQGDPHQPDNKQVSACDDSYVVKPTCVWANGQNLTWKSAAAQTICDENKLTCVCLCACQHMEQATTANQDLYGRVTEALTLNEDEKDRWTACSSLIGCIRMCVCIYIYIYI